MYDIDLLSKNSDEIFSDQALNLKAGTDTYKRLTVNHSKFGDVPTRGFEVMAYQKYTQKINLSTRTCMCQLQSGLDE